MTTTNNNNIGISLQDFIAKQETTRRIGRKGNFTEYGSKKKIIASGLLTEQQAEDITNLKGTFSFHMHNDNEYLIIVMYNRNAEVKYSFLVVKLADMTVTVKESIKVAKEYVEELLDASTEKSAQVVEETKKEEVKVEETVEEEEEVDIKKVSKPKKTKKVKEEEVK